MPLSYSFSWNFRNCWDQVPDFIAQKYLENILKPKIFDDEEEEKQKETFEEIALEEGNSKPFSKYAYFLNKVGNFKNKIVAAANSTNIYNFFYAKSNIDYEKEYKNIAKILSSSMILNDENTNSDLSIPSLIQITLDNINGLNKELNIAQEKTLSIIIDEKNINLKRNEFSEILKSYIQVYSLIL